MVYSYFMSRLFIAVLTFATLINFSYGKEVVRFASLEYCPLICNPEKEPLNRHGIMIELLKLIFEKDGYTIEVSRMPFKRAIMEVRSGNYDGIVASNKSELPDFIFPKHPLLINKAKIFTRKDNKWIYQNIKSLKEIHLLAVKEFGYANRAIEEYLEKAHTDNVTRMVGGSYTQRAVELLQKGTVDAYIDGHLVFQYVAGLKGIGKRFKAASKVLGVFKNYTSFTPSNPERSRKLSNIFDKRLAEITASGEYQKVLYSYGIHKSE